MVNTLWMGLSAVALVGGTLIILAPKLVAGVNGQLSRVLVSIDDLVMRYRHIVGVTLLIIAYVCFNLALVVPTLPKLN